MQDFIAPQLKAEFLALRDAAFIKDVVLERRIDNLKELFTQMEGVSDPQLQSKIKEECVRLASSVQEMRFLVPLEWFPCKEDGDFGPKTQEIVKQFQKAKGIPVSGEVDQPTWAALLA